MGKPKALIIWNDTIHHKGSVKSAFWEERLVRDGFDVERSGSAYPLCDPGRLRECSLIVLSWSEEQIIREQALNLIDAVGFGGVGLAGYHETSTAFRQYDWHFLLGSFMATHPGRKETGSKLSYTVRISKPDDPITRGIKDFEHYSEQFYLLHDGDNMNEVLADTLIADSDYPWIKGLRSPVAYKRLFGAGKVFYSSLGHFPEEFEREEVFKITRRGMLWASKTLPEGLSIE
jgi:type 1 glutamine amidotransferase